MFPIASAKGSSSCIRNDTHYGYDWCRIKSIIGFSLITFSVWFWIKMMVFMRYCQKSTIGTLKCKVLIGSPWAECPVSSSRGLSVNENVQPWLRNWRMLAGAGPLPVSALAQQKHFGSDLPKPMLYGFQKFYFISTWLVLWTERPSVGKSSTAVIQEYRFQLGFNRKEPSLLALTSFCNMSQNTEGMHIWEICF